MCQITITRYVRPDGRRENVEKKYLCDRSDGHNPCLYHTRREITEEVPPSTPSLGYDLTPASTSMPGTPLAATANYEIREPQDPYRTPSKGKGKARPIQVTFGGRRKSRSPKAKRPEEHTRRHYDEDDDPVVAIEDHGRMHSSNMPPPPPPPPGFGPSLSSRSQQRPVQINQPHPPSSPFLRPVTQPSYGGHRRTATAPENISFHADNEFGRASARDDLRRQNREYQRQQDEAKRQQEDADRRYAEKLQEKERIAKAEDAFSRLEYDRLQEKDQARRRRQEEQEQAVADRAARDIKERREREKRRRDDQRRKEEAEREEELRKTEEARENRIIEEELERRRLQRLAASEQDLLMIQDQIDDLEMKLRANEERTAARERAERLQESVRKYNLLQDEIRLREQAFRRDAIGDNDAEVRRLEADLSRLNTRIHERERVAGEPIDGPRFNERRNIGTGSRSPTVDVLQTRRPIEDAAYRRAFGEQILERDRSLASARAAASELQGVMGTTGVSRRNTIGGGARLREQNYRNLRHWYPE